MDERARTLPASSEWRRSKRISIVVRPSDWQALVVVAGAWKVAPGAAAWAILVEALYLLSAFPGERDRLARMLARAAIKEGDARTALAAELVAAMTPAAPLE